jgi:hypothetical protein
MAEIVNLRRLRKQKARAEARAAAAENAARHGQGKADRSLQQAKAEQAARRLDGHRLERDGPETGPQGSGKAD